MKTPKEELREEFAQKFSEKFTTKILPIGEYIMKREEIADWWLSKIQERDQALITTLEEKKKSTHSHHRGSYVEEKDQDYNQALDEAITIIKNTI